jgi:transposase-like protein
LESCVRENPVCPHCGHDKISRWGFAQGLQRYRCGACGKTFNEVGGAYAAQRGEGSSVRKAAMVLGVNPNTPFRWRHRFLSGLPSCRRSSRSTKRISWHRTGNKADFVLEKDDQAHVSAVLKPLLSTDAVRCTDSSRTLAAVAKEIGVTHRAVNRAVGQRVIAGAYHVQNVNAYDSRLKEWMRRFHGVATQYLPQLLGLAMLSGTPFQEHLPRQHLARRPRQ